MVTSVLLSNRQYAALKLFIERERGLPMGVEEALQVDQRSLGSLYHRKYIKVLNGGFVVTDTGMQAMNQFEGTSVMKDYSSKNLSHYIRLTRAAGRLR